MSSSSPTPSPHSHSRNRSSLPSISDLGRRGSYHDGSSIHSSTSSAHVISKTEQGGEPSVDTRETGEHESGSSERREGGESGRGGRMREDLWEKMVGLLGEDRVPQEERLENGLAIGLTKDLGLSTNELNQEKDRPFWSLNKDTSPPNTPPGQISQPFIPLQSNHLSYSNRPPPAHSGGSSGYREEVDLTSERSAMSQEDGMRAVQILDNDQEARNGKMISRLPPGISRRPVDEKSYRTLHGGLSLIERNDSDGGLVPTPRPGSGPRRRQTSATLSYALQSIPPVPTFPSPPHNKPMIQTPHKTRGESIHSFTTPSPHTKDQRKPKRQGHPTSIQDFDGLENDPSPPIDLDKSFPAMEPEMSPSTSPSRKTKIDTGPGSIGAGDKTGEKERRDEVAVAWKKEEEIEQTLWKSTLPLMGYQRSGAIKSGDHDITYQDEKPIWDTLDIPAIDRQLAILRHRQLVQETPNLTSTSSSSWDSPFEGEVVGGTGGLEKVQSRLEDVMQEIKQLREEMNAVRMVESEGGGEEVPPKRIEVSGLCSGFFQNLSSCQDIILKLDEKMTGHRRAEEVVFSRSNLEILGRMVKKDQVD